MSDLIFLRTVPHTGTFFCEHLLGAHSLISDRIVDLDGGRARSSLNFLIDRVLDQEISFEEFKKLIICASYDRSSVVESSISKNEIEKISSHFDYEYIVLVSHIVSAFYQKKYWIADLLSAGFMAKTLTPLRDPVLTVLTILIQTGDENSIHKEDWYIYAEAALTNTFQGYQHLASLPEKWKPFTYFLAVDLLAKFSPGERLRRVRSLFIDFLKIGIEPLVEKEIENWTVRHATEQEQLYGEFSKKSEFEHLIEARRICGMGKDPRGLDRKLDAEIDKYSECSNLQDFFKSQGYSNLCWFR